MGPLSPAGPSHRLCALDRRRCSSKVGHVIYANIGMEWMKLAPPRPNPPLEASRAGAVAVYTRGAWLGGSRALAPWQGA